MEYSTIVLGVVLLFFGILFILLMVYVVKTQNAAKKAKGVSEVMPPLDYMKNIGYRCPDYWEDLGEAPGKPGYHICFNKFNIPVENANNPVCYSDKEGRTKIFRSANPSQWSGNEMPTELIKERCQFVDKCGPSSNMTASWLGVSSEQLSPGYVNCGAYK
jgi:hypothetical protein